MGIFNRRGGEKASRNQESANGQSGWDNMDVPFQGGRQAEQQKTAEELSAERQQRKILAAFALGENGHVSNEPFKHHDVSVNEDTRDAVLEMMARGKIGKRQEDELINDIRSPLQQNGYDSVMQSLGTRQEKRILTSMSETGFDRWQDASTNDLETFIKMYPSPRSFEEQSKRFLEMIHLNNSEEKYQQYVGAMESFKRKVYGKKQEYWEQVKALRLEADEKKLNRDTEWKQATNTSNDWNEFRKPDNAELEDNYEWKPGEAGYWQTSRAQARAGEVNRYNIDRGLWADRSCEDSMFVRPDQNMYGVFDGAGGHQGGRLASELTASVVREFSDRYGNSLNSGSSLAFVLNAANERVAKNPDAGLSTAVLAKAVKKDGRTLLAYASVGDSRLYIVDKEGNARQITRDEGEGRFITNAIGEEVGPGEGRTQQWGEVALRKGDRIVLCSDGVTGDYGADIMEPRELGFLVSRSQSAQEASKNLLANARKFDDRTAIVVGEY